MLAQSYAPVVGGEERIVEDLSAELCRRGHEVAVATLRQPLGKPPPSEDGVRVHLLGRAGSVAGRRGRCRAPLLAPGPDPVTSRDLRRVLRRERPDVVHAHNWLVDSYLPLSRGSGVALVLSLHDYSLVCATKRFFRNGGVCERARRGQVPGPLDRVLRGGEGRVVSAGMRVSEPWARRRVDMFLPVSEAVRDLCGLAPGGCNRVVPNFIGELPAPPAGERSRCSPRCRWSRSSFTSAM